MAYLGIETHRFTYLTATYAAPKTHAPGAVYPALNSRLVSHILCCLCRFPDACLVGGQACGNSKKNDVRSSFRLADNPCTGNGSACDQLQNFICFLCRSLDKCLGSGPSCGKTKKLSGLLSALRTIFAQRTVQLAIIPRMPGAACAAPQTCV